MAKNDLKIEKLPNSRVRFMISVGEEKIKQHYSMALKKISHQVEIKGFRKGFAPESLVIERAGNSAVINEMLESLIPETYYLFLKDNSSLLPVEQPKVNVTEIQGLAEGQLIPTSIDYSVEVDVMPEVEPPAYKKLKIKPKLASDLIDAKEVDQTVEQIKKMHGDEYLKAGNFKDDNEMRQAISDMLKQQKVIEAESQTYDEIIESLLKQSKLAIPNSFVQNELHRMERQVEMQAKAYGMTFEDWLKSEKKTLDEIHKDWEPQATKAAKVGLILGKIAEAEGIDPSDNQATRKVMEKLYQLATQHFAK